MSDKPIAVGDLVVVVRGHPCVFAFRGGVPFKVKKFVSQIGGGWTCNNCGMRDIEPETKIAAQLWHTSAHGGVPLWWLKRIPPLEELEGVKTEEQIKEPA
jgi:hypothetical protein